jgi:hypothetical protein
MGRDDLRTEELRTAFERAFGAPPELVVRSPGRVNLIGEHTDYNDGFTLPVALDLGTDVAVRRRPDGLLRTVARRLDAADTRPVEALRPTEGPEWARYVAGAAALLRESRGNLPGADLLIDSDLPIGAGLSSSASLELGVLVALLGLTTAAIDRTELARLGQRVENEIIGVRTGIMGGCRRRPAVVEAASGGYFRRPRAPPRSGLAGALCSCGGFNGGGARRHAASCRTPAKAAVGSVPEQRRRVSERSIPSRASRRAPQDLPGSGGHVQVESGVDGTQVVAADLPDAPKPVAERAAVDQQRPRRGVIVPPALEVLQERRDQIRPVRRVVVEQRPEPLPDELGQLPVVGAEGEQTVEPEIGVHRYAGGG